MTRSTRGVLLVLVVSLVAAACSGSHHRGRSGPGVTPSTGEPATGLKPLIQGLVDKDGPPPAGFGTVVRAYVVNVNWADLQLAPGAAIPAGNPIDEAIAAVRQLNQRSPGLDLKLRLRVYTGTAAPDWAKSIGGPPIPFVSLQGQATTLGRFWLPGYGAAYQDLMDKLAARYDDVPEIREVEVSRCAADTDEPFRNDANISPNGEALLAAGYTIAAAQVCETAQLDESRAWKHTSLDLDLSPTLQTVTARGRSGKDDFAFTESVIAYCRQTLGPQCVLENNSLVYPVKEPDFTSLYAAMKQAGPPLAFQTIVNNGARHGLDASSLEATLQYGAGLGANSIELHQGFSSFITSSQLSSYNAALAGNKSQ